MRTPILLLGMAAACLALVGCMTAKASPAPETKVGNATSKTLEESRKKGWEIATVGGGCFWCVEGDFRGVRGIVATDVGYSGGRIQNPTYEQVCTGTTGHVEVTRLEFDPKVISYRDVIRKFFQVHDPTQGFQQGPDIGEQYRSVIYFHSAEQKKVAQEEMAAAQKKLDRKITTTIEPAPTYWRAEEYHQQYYEKKGIKRGG